MKTRFLLVFLTVTMLSVLIVGEALAAGSFSSYNMTIPKLGGSNSTGNVTKVNAADKAVVCSQAIGNGYTLNARIELLNNTAAASYQSISNLQRREYTLNPSNAGTSYHARIATTIVIPVDVQATGSWSPDNPGPCGW